MASVTLVEAQKLAQDELVAGVIEDIITVNQMFQLIPFDGISGNSLAYNRENALGEVVVTGVGDLIASQGLNPITSATDGTLAATFTKVNDNLTTIIGDAFVNNLIQVTLSDDGNDQTATQVASKAKHAGRVWQDMLINGDSGSDPDQFDGLILRCTAQQTVATGTNGGPLSFEFLDELLDLVVDKDGLVEYIIMADRTIRSYKTLLRGLGGTSADEVVVLPSGQRIIGYSGVPIFRNDFIPKDQVKGSGSSQTTIFAGTFDDGSRSHGIAGLTARNAVGIQVREVGESETKDEMITRVAWYCGLANFSQLGLACADGITD